MRQYELMVILKTGIDPTDTKKVEFVIRKFLGSAADSIKDISIWGKKHLAYPIEKNLDGIYVLLKLESDRIEIAGLQKQKQLMEDIVRFLLTVKEERKYVVKKS